MGDEGGFGAAHLGVGGCRRGDGCVAGEEVLGGGGYEGARDRRGGERGM